MAHRNKRPKLNDYRERHTTYGYAAPHERFESSSGESRGSIEHSGQGVQNVDGNFYNGGDFDASHNHHNSNVTIQQTIISQPPDRFNRAITNEEKRRDLLESLSFVQIDARRTSIKSALKTTCQWFLKTPEYRKWLNTAEYGKHGGFLWIKGKPGAGKSTLMKFTFSHVHQTFRKQGITIVSFFFNARGEELEKSTVGLYRSILLQLLEEHPELQHILDSTRPGHQWNAESLKSLIEEAVRAMGKASLIFFIDALDECEERQVRDMLSFLKNLSEQAASARTKLLVCFASRHYPHITIAKGLELVIEAKREHQQDIVEYLNTELRIGHDELAEEIRSVLKYKASGIFLWVVLVVDILNKEYDRGRKNRLLKRLEDIPEDLHELFHSILTRDRDITHELVLCIQWVLFARRPLTLEELYFAIIAGAEPDSLFSCHPEQGISREDMQRYILDNSKGLAESTKSETPTIQFIHESVRDFLLKENGLQKIWPELEPNVHGQSHEKLKRCCFAYMNHRIVRDFKLPKPLPRAHTVDAANPRQDAAEKLPFLEYAHHGILYHADKAESNGVTQYEFLSTFPLRAWIEYHNLFERYQTRRYTSKASLLYILAECDLPSLIRIQDCRQSCFAMEKERYGTPIFAALATRSNEAAKALLVRQVRNLPPDSPLHKRCETFAESEDNVSNLSRSFRFSMRRTVASHICETNRVILLDVLLCTEGIENLDREPRLLHWVAGVGHEFAVRLLLDQGANIDGNGSYNPLCEAVRRGHEVLIKLFLDRGADVNGTSGRNPLCVAVQEGHEALIKLLLDRGADVNGTSGRNPLCVAVQEGHEALIKLFLDRGADVNGTSGRNPLCVAVQKRHEALIKLLLDRGADVNGNGVSADHWNPLSAAVLGCGCATVRLLLERGALTEVRTRTGFTPLLLAARYGPLDIVRLLLDSGADINARCNDSKGVLSLASIGHGGDAVIQLLRERGACDD
ncbi:hypothetical protein F5Y05DRAFT_270401 [Hypoxylon sp. FL0543]|nr:hypothetical protein F5Y05DRAFT_270401 [Hypoxylon sp. FL0543]